jgi:hypothetical protein
MAAPDGGPDDDRQRIDTPGVPSHSRDPGAPAPNRPRRVGVTAVVEIDGGVLLERRADLESLELRAVSRDEPPATRLWPAHTPVRDAHLSFAGTTVAA